MNDPAMTAQDPPQAAAPTGEGTTETPIEVLTGILGFMPSAEQCTAITAPLEPGLIEAGAGTGKTTVMAARVAWLVRCGVVAPHQVLGLTFTNKAVGELDDRIQRDLRAIGIDTEADEQGSPTVRTYHGFAKDLLAEFGLLIGVEPDAQLLSDVDRIQCMRRFLVTVNDDLPHLRPRLGEAARIVLALDDAMAEQNLAASAVLGDCASLQVRAAEHPGGRGSAQAMVDRLAAVARERGDAVRLVERWREWKRAAGVIDFSDQVRLARELLDTRPEVVARLRERHRAVLLDEYQDTSIGQRDFLRTAFGAGHPVTAVGDPLQTIFEWRAASVANLSCFVEHFPLADGSSAPTFKLTVNRRSLPLIVDTANAVTHEYRLRRGGEPLMASRTPENGVAVLPRAAQVSLGLYLTWPDEVAAVADRVAAAVERARACGQPASSIAVLARTNRALVDVLRALDARGVPAALTHVGGLLEMPEVVEVVSMLEVVADPGANPAALRLLAGPRWAIGPRDLALLGRRAQELVGAHHRPTADASLSVVLAAATAASDALEVVSLVDAAADPGAAPYGEGVRENLAAFTAELAALRVHAHEPVGDLVSRIIEVTGLGLEVATGPSASGARGEQVLAAFTGLADDFRSGDGSPSLSAFLDWLALARESRAAIECEFPAPADAVALCTVHSAKGLEWPIVHIVGLCEGSFPSTHPRARWTGSPEVLPARLRAEGGPLAADPVAWSSQGFTDDTKRCRGDEQDEELRLAYVAITRARDELVMTGHHWGGGSKPRQAATYLSDAAKLFDAANIARQARPEGHGSDVAVLTWVTDPGPSNPVPQSDGVPWPTPEPTLAWLRHAEVAAEVRQRLDRLAGELPAGELPAGELPAGELPAGELPLSSADQCLLTRWDREITTVLARARAQTDSRGEPPDAIGSLPEVVGVTTLLHFVDNPREVRRATARPLPRVPSRQAQRGTRLHGRIEGHYRASALFDPTDLPGASDEGLLDDAAEQSAFNAFRDSAWGRATPIEVEWPFEVVVAGRVLRGRVDAVFAAADGVTLVDWKTAPPGTADPRQLALYRLAWRHLRGVGARVRASYVYLPSLAEYPSDGDLTWQEVEAWLADA